MTQQRKPSSTCWQKKALHGAVVLAMSSLGCIPAAHAKQDCTNGTIDQYDCVLDNTQNLTISNGVTFSNDGTRAALRYQFVDQDNMGDLGAGQTLTNNGNISAVGDGSSEDIFNNNNALLGFNWIATPLAGVHIDNELLGTLNNNGSISASDTATGSLHAIATGVFEGSPIAMQGTLNNAVGASISATAAAEDGNSFAAGVYISNSVAAAAQINNHGSISASASLGNMGEDQDAMAAGIYAKEFNGTLNNSGTISASSSLLASGLILNKTGADAVINNSGTISSEGPFAATVFLNDFHGTLNNTGEIAASGESVSFALLSRPYGDLDTHANDGVINNQSTGAIRGAVLLVNDPENSQQLQFNNHGMLDLSPSLGHTFMGTSTSLIVGNYTQSSTGTLRIAASGSNAGEYNALAVYGNASIAGKVFVDVKEANTLTAGATLANVVSAGNLEGNFSVVEDNSAMFNFHSVASSGEGGHIDLTVVKALTATQAATDNSNNPGLGAAGIIDSLVDNGTSNPDMQNVLTELGKLQTSQQLSQAMTILSPPTNSSAATQGAMGNTNSVVQSQVEGQYGRSGGDNTMADKRAWVKPFGSIARQDDRDGVSGYESHSYGFVAGADATVGNLGRLGVAFAYSQANIDGNSTVAHNSATVDSYQLVSYGSRSLNDNTDLSFQADIGLHNTHGDRQISIGAINRVAQADYHSWSAHLGAGLARSYAMSAKTTLTPSIRADYTVLQDKGYTETGADAVNLIVDGKRTEEMLLSLDAKLTHALSERTTVTANLGAGYNFLSERSSITASFAGAPSAAFVTQGAEPSAWLARGGLGVITKLDNGMELSARYDVDVREGFSNQTASLKARWMF